MSTIDQQKKVCFTLIHVCVIGNVLSFAFIGQKSNNFGMTYVLISI